LIKHWGPNSTLKARHLADLRRVITGQTILADGGLT
jgi:hypothetical protein